MNLDRLLDRTRAIQRIPSPTFHERERGRYLETEFHAAGLDEVQVDPVGNVYGRLVGGPSPPLILSAHLDTVFPMDTSLDLREQDGRLIGPGVGDNAVALSALVELALELGDPALAGDVWFVANTAEEGLGNLGGMREVVARFKDSVTAYVVLEGMALGHVYHRGLPSRRYRITARTSGGHSWIHSSRPSAVHTLVRLGARLLEIPLPAHPKTTLNIGRIEGGTTVNSIARTACFEIDLRSEEEEDLVRLEKRLKKLAVEGAANLARVSVEQIGARPGGAIPERHPLVRAACAALEEVGEGPPKLGPASTDASYPLSLGLPAVCVGLTYGGEAHTPEEYIELDPLPRGYSAVAGLARAIFRVR